MVPGVQKRTIFPSFRTEAARKVLGSGAILRIEHGSLLAQRSIKSCAAALFLLKSFICTAPNDANSNTLMPFGGVLDAYN